MSNTAISKIGAATAVFEKLYGKAAVSEQVERYEDLVGDFEKTFPGHQDLMFFSSPGRTEIGGNHTDHQLGRVLAGAVNMDNIAVASPNGTNVVRIKSAGFPKFEVDLNDLNPSKSEKYTSDALVRGISARLKELGFKIGGFDACIEGRVPKGSGISSSASFEVLIGAIISHLFNDGKLDPVQNAIIGQYAENNFFFKPCGLMDQMACSVGGLITIDFKDPANPIVKKLDFDFTKTGYALVITDTKGDHSNLNEEYAALPAEMKSVAVALGKTVQRELTMEDLIKAIPSIRGKVSDRAILRAMHFQGDNARVVKEVEALESQDFQAFLQMVIESGQSSYMYNQNIFATNNVEAQGVSIGLALSELILKGKGAWRVHGGGFAGTIQAFVPQDLLDTYVDTLEHVFGKGACHKMFIRNEGSIRVEI